MAQYFQLAQRGVSSLSIDGIEHKADPESGILTVEMMTPNLNAELRERGAIAVEGPQAGKSGGSSPERQHPEPPRPQTDTSGSQGRKGHVPTPGGVKEP